ncbi:MAG: FeoC-like transcriptional regulator [Methylococcales bacterium]
MILSELKVYLQQNRRVMLTDMARRFDMEPDTLRGMLTKWVNKGKVRKVASNAACSGGCCKCDPASLELYEWLE